MSEKKKNGTTGANAAVVEKFRNSHNRKKTAKITVTEPAVVAAGEKMGKGKGGKPGRKPVPADRKKKNPVTVYLSDREMKALRERAAEFYMTPEKFLGIMVRKEGIVVEDE